jgi:hypothetical protein
MTEKIKVSIEELMIELEKQKFDFEEATKCCVEAIGGMNKRLERIEKWILDLAKEKH